MSRKKNKPIMKVGVVVLVNIMVFFFLIIGFGREYVGNLQIEHEIKLLEKEKESLEQQKLETLQLVDELSSEYYLEKEARIKHGFSKPGEEVLVFSDGGDIYDENFSGTGLDESNIKNYQKWYYYFFNRQKFELLKNI